ncbi:MAG: topology modulation protein [Streptosporangiales bacterium]|nr:topology modulation protein [Streptosporangiales bacterium]
MKKVAVVGSCGSGKSYLARALGEILDAPVIHLDAIYYNEAWNELPMERFAEIQRELVAGPSWVIDGNYNATLPIRLGTCDTVVLMDVSSTAALYGLLSRRIRHGAGHKGDGVHNRIHGGVLRYTATYRRRMRPRVLAKIERFAEHADVVLLTGRRRARWWLRRVGEGAGGRPGSGVG